MLQNVSKSQVIERLQFENPWWATGQIDEDYRQMKRRLYFDLFKPLAFETDVRRALVLMGPRRVGKTVMLFHLAQELINSGVNPQRVVFITIENPIYVTLGLEELFSSAKEAVASKDKDGWYVIYDEIQYCKDWERHLKTLVDSHRGCKFIASGSAAAALKYKSNESGAGRFTDFLLPPLTFHEYIDLKGLGHIIKPTEVLWKGEVTDFYTGISLGELNRHFIDYINYGGYPEVIFSPKIQANPGRFIRQDIVDKVLLRDLPSLYGISDVQELNVLFTTIAYNTGNEFSYEALSKQSGVQKITLKKYIEYLEAAFLVKRVRRIGQGGKRFLRDNSFKLYITNPSMRSALFAPLHPTDDLLGPMVETAIFAQWMHRDGFRPWYAHWKEGKTEGEVDMIGLSEKNLKPQWALEIKWSNRYYERPADLKSLLRFCEANELKETLVTTIDKEGFVERGDVRVNYLPSAAYAYTVGKRTLEMKKKK